MTNDDLITFAAGIVGDIAEVDNDSFLQHHAELVAIAEKIKQLSHGYQRLLKQGDFELPEIQSPGTRWEN
jgi:hypothetical protein